MPKRSAAEGFAAFFFSADAVVVLTMSGVALLDKAGWAPLGAGDDDTHPILVGVIGLVMLVLVHLVWGILRRGLGLPMFGAPTLNELDTDRRQAAAGAEGAPPA